MRETVKKSIFSRLLSGTLAFAVALSMAFGAFGITSHADDSGSIWVLTDGRVGDYNDLGNPSIDSMVADITGPSSLVNSIKYDSTKKEITIQGISTPTLVINKSDITIVINGECKITELYLNAASLTGITIQMTKGSKLTLNSINIAGTQYALSDTEWGSNITIKDSAISGNVITASASAPDPVNISGGSSTSTPIEVGSVAYEQNETPSTSASYKVTSTDEGNRTVTYDKPAQGAEGTEQVKASVTLTDGNTYKVTAISEDAFNNFENKNKIKKIEIADTVKEIGNNACKDMSELTDVTGGKGVTSIGKGAFSNCSKLKNFSGFDNLEIINDEAFSKCKKLTKVTIGIKVKKIGKKAYNECSSLKNITVKSTKLTKKSKVGAKAFWKIHKKAKFKMKMSKKNAKKFKAKTIKVFKNKSIGYVKTWKVS